MEVIGIFDAGTGTIQTPHGKKNVGFVNIKTSERESSPIDNLFWYELHRQESIIRAFGHLHPYNLEKSANA